MKITYFLMAMFVMNSCTSARKPASSATENSDTKAVAVKATKIDSAEVSTKNKKDSNQIKGMPEILKTQLGNLIPKKPF